MTPTSPHPITDREVAELPVHAGRAELLEEILRTPVEHAERAPLVDLAPRHRRRLVSVAAAAAVVVTVAGLAAWQRPRSTTSPRPDGSGFVHRSSAPGESHTITKLTVRPHSSGGPLTPQVRVRVTRAAPPAADQLARTAPIVSGGAYVALNEDGWAVTGLSDDAYGRDVLYQRGDALVDVTTYPASEYPSYVADRTGDAGSPEATTLLGRSAGLFTYASDDHAVLRAPDGDRFLEVRGQGMSETDFRAVLADLVQTDEAGFARSMPPGTVTPYNRDEAIQHLLRGVETPPGFTADQVSLLGFNDGYQSAARVAGSVGCAWLDRYADGSAADRSAAIDAFAGSRSWALLRHIADQGGYSSVFWSVAGQLRSGHDEKGRPVDVAALKHGLC